MNALTSYTFPTTNTQIRTVMIEGNPWFVAADVCKALELAQITNALKALYDDEKGLNPIKTPGGMQRLNTISESGLYRLLMRSDKPNAKAFQDWVTRIVLPAIRKDGAYIQGEEKLASGEMSEDEFVLKAISILQNKVERLKLRRRPLVIGNPA